MGPLATAALRRLRDKDPSAAPRHAVRHLPPPLYLLRAPRPTEPLPEPVAVVHVLSGRPSPPWVVLTTRRAPLCHLHHARLAIRPVLAGIAPSSSFGSGEIHGETTALRASPEPIATPYVTTVSSRPRFSPPPCAFVAVAPSSSTPNAAAAMVDVELHSGRLRRRHHPHLTRGLLLSRTA